MTATPYLDRSRAAPVGSEEQDNIEAEIAAQIALAGEPTEAAMRDQLRALMAECPACDSDEVEYVATDKLVAWILSHGAEPGAKPEAPP